MTISIISAGVSTIKTGGLSLPPPSVITAGLSFRRETGFQNRANVPIATEGRYVRPAFQSLLPHGENDLIEDCSLSVDEPEGVTARFGNPGLD